MPPNMDALIAALEQARSALDTIEAEATQTRKAKKAAPPVAAPKIEVEVGEDEGGMEG